MTSPNKIAERIIKELEEAGYDNVLLTAVNSTTSKAFTAINGDNKGYLNALSEELNTKLSEILDEEDEDEEMDDIPDELKALLLAIMLKNK